MPVPFALEQQVAIAAVRRACALTTTVFNKLVAGETLVKGDKSPVTVADYSAQAVINTILSHAFPDDPIVGEEDAADLRAPTKESEVLRARVVELADDVLAQPPLSSSSSSSSPALLPLGIDPASGDGDGELAEWGLGKRWGVEAILKAIDRGADAGGRRSGRMWTLDPIDGTKGFLRGGQYAVCLALLVDARVELGVIGCPNLPTTTTTTSSTSTTSPNDDDKNNNKGALFVAVRGHGAHQLPLRPPPTATSSGAAAASVVRLSMPRLALHELSFLESFDPAHAALDTNARIAHRLGVRAAPLRMDSQAKYAALARGDGGGGVYLRLPVAGSGRGGGGGGGYEEKIWVRDFVILRTTLFVFKTTSHCLSSPLCRPSSLFFFSFFFCMCGVRACVLVQDHASGSLLVEEAGGVISDSRGLPLDFGLGRTLGRNFGVVAARKEVHAQVIDAIQAVLAEGAEEGEREEPAVTIQKS
ncbi:hypothetical protein BJV74DRAFT_951621 [Russula compacta]|nr:hypothetical protein BJV74DRAFT_951621 [Russula compacta]